MSATNQTVVTYEKIKAKILNGNYSPSENLPEMELSTQYKVSRNTIKKVLLMLEKENLVSIEINKGAKVKSYSMEEVKEFLDLRSELEGFIARITVPEITEEDIKSMEEIILQMEQMRSQRDLLGYSSLNRTFHEVIYNACPNKTAVAMTKNLKTQMGKYNAKTILVPGRDAQSFSEHCAILDAIKNRNSQLTEVLLKSHINNVKQTFEQNFSLLF